MSDDIGNDAPQPLQRDDGAAAARPELDPARQGGGLAPDIRPPSASASSTAPATAGGLRQRWRASLTRDKSDTLLLLLAALLVLTPHLAHLPLWTGVTIGATLLWRAAITLRGRRLPPLALLLPVSLASMAGVWLSYRTLLGRDAGVAMLALLLAFKLLEMRARRDLFVVVFLSFFLLLTEFFYDQSILTALLMLATIVVLLATQLTFQYTGRVPPLAQRLRLAATIVAGAAPLALLLFIVFPRIQGPLWGLPGDARSGHSGMSDSMAPGNLSSLALSDDVAFRVHFIDPVPAQRQLYWRGIVLGDFDGRTWRRVARLPQLRGLARPQIGVNISGRPVRHEVTMEATGKRWLFALELTGPTLELPGYRVGNSDEMEYYTIAPLSERLRYSASAWLDFHLQADAAPAQLQQWLALPAGYNPRTLALAHQLRASHAAPADAVQAVLQMFRREPFSYTLEPPVLGRDSVDDFLFSTRAGFCEHYASAFVVLMRAMDIPARVVTGYQGGELNPVDGYLTVRQSDAHAWAEVWLAGQGWRRVDPTAAIAPERIEHNLARALPRQAPFGLTGLGGLLDFDGAQGGWLAQWRFRLSALNNAWNQWVLDYNPDRQRSFLAELSSDLGNWRTAAALLAVAALLMLAQRLRQLRAIDPLAALYQAFCRQQAQHGYARAPGEGPHSYALRLRGMPASAAKHAAMDEFLRLYGALQYGKVQPDQLAAALRQLTNWLHLSR